jgi:hypothetical protein
MKLSVKPVKCIVLDINELQLLNEVLDYSLKIREVVLADMNEPKVRLPENGENLSTWPFRGVRVREG